MTIEIRPVPAAELDEGCAEGWERVTDDPDILGISAIMITLGEQPYWTVGVAVAEYPGRRSPGSQRPGSSIVWPPRPGRTWTVCRSR